MKAYVSWEADVEQLKAEAQAEWETWKDESIADLALLIQADLHGRKSEQRLGKESLQMTQASLLEATGGILLSDDARQVLVIGVSLFSGNVPEYVLFLFLIYAFPSTFSQPFAIFIFRLYVTFSWPMRLRGRLSNSVSRPSLESFYRLEGPRPLELYAFSLIPLEGRTPMRRPRGKFWHPHLLPRT